MTQTRLVAMAWVWLAIVCTPVAAQEYCVTCTDPVATYRCTIADATSNGGQSLQVACISALARDGKHSQCSIKRGVTVFECDAPLKRISVGDGALEPRVLAPPPMTIPDPKAPPATVAEALKRAKSASDEQSAATASFLKKGLACLGSLFTNCQ